MSSSFVFQPKSFAPTDFATNIRQPSSHNIADENEEVHSSGNKEETVADVEDSTRKGKEKVADLPKATKKRGGNGKICSSSGKPLDSRHLEAQRHAELEMPSEPTATIQILKSR
jgi:RNA polymerase-binding transcription factor DksA